MDFLIMFWCTATTTLYNLRKLSTCLSRADGTHFISQTIEITQSLLVEPAMSPSATGTVTVGSILPWSNALIFQ
jgi:hypothetical protein